MLNATLSIGYRLCQNKFKKQILLLGEPAWYSTFTKHISFISRPRSVPAVGVIFSELRIFAGTVRRKDLRRLYHQIKKRSIFKYRGKQFWIANSKAELPSYSQVRIAIRKSWPRTIGFLTKAWNTLMRFQIWIAKNMYKKLPRAFKKIVKKMGRIEARMHKKMVCLEPRLRRRYGKLVYPEGLTVKSLKEKKKNFIKDFIEYVKNGNAEDEEVEYIEDCFDDMERPRFGYMMKIMLKENEPCQIDFENPDQTTCNLTSNANSEDLNESSIINSKYYAQSRQTGQDFRSAAPPDCRIELCQDDDND